MMRIFFLLFLTACTQDFGAFEPKDASTIVDTSVKPDGMMTSDTGTGDGGCAGTVFNGHCYYAINGGTFDQSQATCMTTGAHLVTITSMAEQNAAAGVGSGERWIGLRRMGGQAIDANYQWITNEPRAGYANWGPTEPNGSGECARFLANAQWADTSCTGTRAAICEHD